MQMLRAHLQGRGCRAVSVDASAQDPGQAASHLGGSPIYRAEEVKPFLSSPMGKRAHLGQELVRVKEAFAIITTASSIVLPMLLKSFSHLSRGQQAKAGESENQILVHEISQVGGWKGVDGMFTTSASSETSASCPPWSADRCSSVRA